MTIKTQTKSFEGRGRFAIGAEHLKADFGEAVITIFVFFLFSPQMDESVYSLGFLLAIHYAR